MLLDDGAYTVDLDTSVEDLQRIASTIMAVLAELQGTPGVQSEGPPLVSGDGVWWEYPPKTSTPTRREPNINNTQPVL